MYLTAIVGIVVMGVMFVLSTAEDKKTVPLPGQLPSRGETIMKETDLGNGLVTSNIDP